MQQNLNQPNPTTVTSSSEIDPLLWKPVIDLATGKQMISPFSKKPIYEETEEGKRQRLEREKLEREEKEKQEKKREYEREMYNLNLLIQNTPIPTYPCLDFTDEKRYGLNAQLVSVCANQLLAPSKKKFVVDDSNRDIIRFLMLYFNNSPLALDVFPDRNYSLEKNILLCGNVGVGKTFLMDVFSLYLKKVNNGCQFAYYKTISQTQLLNHYKQHNNIDYYTFHTSDSDSFEGKPFSLCLNDIGLKTQRFYGNDTEMIIEEFLYARYEIWEQQGIKTHLTTNLDEKGIKELFSDSYGRLADRFKMFNVIPLTGKSRR